MSSTIEVLDESIPPPDAALLVDDLSSDVADELIEIAPPKFFYGWLMLPLAMLLLVASSPGQTFGFSFFNAKFRAAFDLSQTRLSATYLIATVLASFAVPYIGGLTDRFGLKRSAMTGIVALAGVCVFM